MRLADASVGFWLNLSTVYFGLAFAVGWVLGSIHELWVVPRFGRTAGPLLEAPMKLVVMFAAPRWTIRLFAVIAESAGVRWVRGLSASDYLYTFTPVSGGVSLLMFLLFAAMPMPVARSPGARQRPDGDRS